MPPWSVIHDPSGIVKRNCTYKGVRMDNLVKTEHIVRHSPPGEFDQLPQSTICEVILISGKTALYEQASEDSSKPVWKEIINPEV
jgi:hypothetical protein